MKTTTVDDNDDKDNDDDDDDDNGDDDGDDGDDDNDDNDDDVEVDNLPYIFFVFVSCDLRRSADRQSGL